ncbi:MAG: cytochrome c [Planctomycetaceae bacterium]
MLVQTGNHPAVLLTASLLLLTGCSESAFESHFVYSDATGELMSEAQNGVGELPGVKDLVEEHFGNPQQLKAWTKLPVKFGGASGTISAEPDTSAAVKELTLELDGDFSVADGDALQLQFVTGDAAPSTVEVARLENGVASLKAALAVHPKQGDQVVINGGGILKHGRTLYMRHCSHCHGTSGDGNGPTARYLTPRPRDYRHGVFKFTSTTALYKASRDDLERVLRNGIPGTYMPSFVPMLNDEDLVAVVEYIRFLAMRGEYERALVAELAGDYSSSAVSSRISGGEKRSEIAAELKDYLAEDLPENMIDGADALASRWTDADSEEALMVPEVGRVEDSEDSRRRGRELYLSSAINCADCHGISGEGNGPQTVIYEKNPVTQELYSESGLHDVWDNVNQPRNLTLGIYRGGRRPVDLFRRIHAGIKGSRMPSFKNLKHEDIWHIVNYVLSLPFEPEPGHGPVPEAAAPAASTASL